MKTASLPFLHRHNFGYCPIVEQLRLRSYKPFNDLMIPLADLTLLSGVNASGKSSVLQGLALVAQSCQFPAARYEPTKLNGELVNFGNADRLYHRDRADGEFEIAVTIGGEEFSWTHSDESPARFDVEALPRHPLFGVHDFEGFARPKRFEDGTDVPTYSRVDGLGPFFQYIRGDRVGPASVYPQRPHHLLADFLGSRGEYAAPLLAEFRNAEASECTIQSIHEGAESGEWLVPTVGDVVERWIARIAPGFAVDVRRGADAGDWLLRMLSPHVAEANASFEPPAVGFGLSYAFPIILACAAARPGSLLLIENPELHLHPRGQSAMGELIARVAGGMGGCQVIVETHSDHVMNGIRRACRRRLITPESVKFHFLERDVGDAQPILRSPVLDGDGSLEFWPRGFFDEWDRALDDLLGDEV